MEHTVNHTSLAKMRQDECYQSLMEMHERDMLAAIKAHFESHPTRPGEKDLKDRVNIWMDNLDNAARMGAAPVHGQYPPLVWNYDGEREDMARQFANIRIREFSVNLSGIQPDDLNLTSVGEYQNAWQNAVVHVYRVPAELYRDKFDDVNVSMERGDGKHEVAIVPDKYKYNNPMNVERCKAEVEITDWSNGKMKPQSAVAKVVVDTDLMSGDVVELDDDMLKGLDQTTTLEQ